MTGGLGFIGFNAASYFARDNHVLVVDDASRMGVENNIRQLGQLKVDFIQANISSFVILKNFLINSIQIL